MDDLLLNLLFQLVMFWRKFRKPATRKVNCNWEARHEQGNDAEIAMPATNNVCVCGGVNEWFCASV